MKNHENRISNNVKPISNKLTVLKISPTKPSTGAIRKSKSDLQKVSKNFQNFINLSYLNFFSTLSSKNLVWIWRLVLVLLLP